MGDRHAVADPRGAEALTVEQGFEDVPLGQVREAADRMGSQFLEDVLLVPHAQGRDDRVRVQKFEHRHEN